jgi:glycosyltransferase involved in cell wall biosynthesis
MEKEVPNPPSKIPKITIGMPTYNSHGKIIRALDSVWIQSYPNLEVIISDNCSIDDTQQLCQAISNNHSEVIYFRQATNIGLIPNFEFVLSHASGDFFIWLADDDALEPGVLNEYVDFLTQHPDYSLVSGKIRYWHENETAFFEKGFTLDNDNGDSRAARYYAKVVYGSLFHGMMRRSLAERIPMYNKIGADFHFVAALAFMGKIENLEIIGYNKRLNGTSRNFDQYAKVIGASGFSRKYPRLAIASDAFGEILESPIYASKQWYSKLTLALRCSTGVLFNYYSKTYPLILGGKIKRYFAQKLPTLK